MPYVKKTVKAGKTVEIFKYHSARYKSTKNNTRRKNHTTTSTTQQRVNQEMSEQKLRWLMNANFSEGDIHLVLTYKQELRPTAEDAVKHLRNYLRRIDRVYTKLGLEFKYITVTEYENAAIHHHLVLPSIDFRLLQDKWPFGRVRPTLLYGDNFGNLASYFIKETSKTFNKEEGCFGKRWNASKNLKQPKITREVIRADSWQMVPKALKGYQIIKDSVRDFVTEDGYMSQFYEMRRIE